MRHLLSVADLDADRALALLHRAEELRGGGAPGFGVAGRMVALAFYQPSTRTRIGFAVAAAKLGVTAVELGASRFTPDMSASESIADTARVVSGMVDLVVLRHGDEHAHGAFVRSSIRPVINAGNGNVEHPTQALIDLFAIRRALGRLTGLRIGLLGDGQTRAAHSLARALRWIEPEEVRLMCPPERPLDAGWTEGLPADVRSAVELDGLDVLYVVGLAPGTGDERLTEARRAPWRVDAGALSRLPAHAIILCPLPRIDEIEPAVDADRRARYFVQSDDAPFVRAAVLEDALR